MLLFLARPYSCVPIESIDSILFKYLTLDAIMLNSSTNTLYFLILNLCCVFNINSLFYMNSLLFSIRLSTLNLFFLNSLFSFQFDLPLNDVYNIQTSVFV